MTVKDPHPAAGPEERMGPRRSPLRLAAGIAGLLALALWASYGLDATAMQDAERHERWSLQALHGRIAALDEQCRSARAAPSGASGERPSRDDACARADDARRQLPAAEAAYRRACAHCAAPSLCEEALDHLRNGSLPSIAIEDCR